jgi:hypothetical protein
MPQSEAVGRTRRSAEGEEPGGQHQIANVGTRPAQYFEIILDPPH